MKLQTTQYMLPDDLDLEGLESRLKANHRFIEDPPKQSEQQFLDSFDWRIWQAGAELVYERQADAGRLCWLERPGNIAAGRSSTSLPPQQMSFPNGECLRAEEPPGKAFWLPEGVLRKRMARALEMRVLLPLVVVKQQQRILRLLNGEDKTVLRLVLQTSRFVSADGEQQGELDGRLELLPLKGYDESLLQMQAELAQLGLEPVSASLFEAALRGIGRRPMDYSSKLNYRLDPQARSDVTAKQILLSLLDTLEANIEGTKTNLDSEFLHDLRVATRRTRSAMSQIKGVFDPQEMEGFRQGFAWLGQITGPTRDMDVYLLKFAAYRRTLPAALQPDLEPFHDFLLAHHRQAQEELARQLDSAKFRKLIKSWREWLEAPTPNVSFQPNAVQPIARLADQRIHKIYKRVLKDGKAVKSHSAPEVLHELRKDCKKLRYLMEFFQSLYPKPEIQGLIKRLKVLLDNLGDFQDLHVQAEAIESFGEEMLKEGAPARALMAMGALVGNLLGHQAQARDEFAELFAGFNAVENRQAFDRLFGKSTPST